MPATKPTARQLTPPNRHRRIVYRCTSDHSTRISSTSTSLSSSSPSPTRSPPPRIRPAAVARDRSPRHSAGVGEQGLLARHPGSEVGVLHSRELPGAQRPPAEPARRPEPLGPTAADYRPWASNSLYLSMVGAEIDTDALADRRRRRTRPESCRVIRRPSHRTRGGGASDRPFTDHVTLETREKPKEWGADPGFAAAVLLGARRLDRLGSDRRPEGWTGLLLEMLGLPDLPEPMMTDAYTN